MPGVALSGHIKDIDKYSAVVRTKKTNYDEMFDVDLSLAKAMGHNAYRFSISWARLFPHQDMLSPDPAGVDYYRNILASLKKHKITPIVSLFHFSTPEWFWFEKNGKRLGTRRCYRIILEIRVLGRRELWHRNQSLVYLK